jgi:hypothetical protein
MAAKRPKTGGLKIILKAEGSLINKKIDKPKKANANLNQTIVKGSIKPRATFSLIGSMLQKREVIPANKIPL